jgi:photosystem II Psb28-2 protein
MVPIIEFFEGLPEQLENVSLRQNKTTGLRNVLFYFKNMKATEQFQSFTKQFYGHLRLVDEEGVIEVEPSSLKFSFGGDDGDELKGAECGFEIHDEGQWDRFMRFMNRYAEANGLGYQEKS